MSAPVPSGEQTVEVGGGISLCYETFGSRGDPPLLLVMGLEMQMIAWHDDFCSGLAAEGFHVVRFDNRDAGRSSAGQGRPPRLTQLVTRRTGSRQYSLEDMAGDAAGLLAELDLAPAHVVGASLGGMIAQTLAAHHPGSVRSLTSIMSTTGNRFRGQPALGMYRHLLATAPTEREAFAAHATKLFGVIGSPGFPPDPRELRERALRSFDRGLNPAGTARQLGAILKSGDRTRDLRAIQAPTLVIHGSADRLVAPSGGRATAAAIPGAELMVIEGMGHDLPRALWPRITAAVARQARRADEALQPA